MRSALNIPPTRKREVSIHFFIPVNVFHGCAGTHLVWQTSGSNWGERGVGETSEERGLPTVLSFIRSERFNAGKGLHQK